MTNRLAVRMFLGYWGIHLQEAPGQLYACPDQSRGMGKNPQTYINAKNSKLVVFSAKGHIAITNIQ